MSMSCVASRRSRGSAAAPARSPCRSAGLATASRPWCRPPTAAFSASLSVTSSRFEPGLRLLRRWPVIDHEPGPGYEGRITGAEKDDLLGAGGEFAEPADRV